MRTISHEPRVIVGIALMIAATVLGALFMQRATQRSTVWQLSHDLAAGTVISSADVHLSEVNVDGGAYASAGTAVVTGCAASPATRPVLSMMVAFRLPAPRSMPRRYLCNSRPW